MAATQSCSAWLLRFLAWLNGKRSMEASLEDCFKPPPLCHPPPPHPPPTLGEGRVGASGGDTEGSEPASCLGVREPASDCPRPGANACGFTKWKKGRSRMWSFRGGLRVLIESLYARIQKPPVLGVAA